VGEKKREGCAAFKDFWVEKKSGEKGELQTGHEAAHERGFDEIFSDGKALHLCGRACGENEKMGGGSKPMKTTVRRLARK